MEEGKLDLDRPLYKYYPYPDIAHDERYKQITARMVLSHQAGFPNWREDDGGQLKIHFEPGTDYRYSGEGYQYLALVLREITGTDWAGLEALFQERVAEPLGLEHTAFIETPYIRANKAQPYDSSGIRIDWENDHWFRRNEGVFVAPASVHSEPADFLKVDARRDEQRTVDERELRGDAQTLCGDCADSRGRGFVHPRLYHAWWSFQERLHARW